MKKIVIVIIVALVLGGGYGYYLYNKPVANTESIDAAYSLSADELFSHFENNETDANTKYLGKIIEVSGKVKEFSIGDSGELNLVLASGSEMNGINCGLSKGQDARYKNYEVGDSIKIKGECSGISMDVVLTRCVIVK
ncbi:MAG: OB-fold putative lipoprotein [Bacteroidota bacterium]|nr:OB-fold putative lipoprotein [Bacteroidota bacterium]